MDCNITIAFSSAKNRFALFGRLIETVESRPFSHALVIYKDPILGVDMVFQASRGLVNQCSLEHFLKKNDIQVSYTLPTTKKQFEIFYSFMIQMLGVKYGWLEILGIGLKKLLHLESPFKDGLVTVICSELCAQVCKILDVNMPEHVDSITPSDLNELLKGYYIK